MSASGSPPRDSVPWNGGSTGATVAWGKSPNRVVGRDHEMERIRSLLDAASSGSSAALLLEGEPGIGKTTLLAAAEQAATDFECLWVRGVESEAVLGHAGVLELATPLHDVLQAVPPAQAAAVAGALGWASSDAPADRFLVAAGTMSLLAAAAEARPVLVLVDDIHWLDPESAGALLFAARRLSRDAVAFLFSRREEAPLPAPTHGIARLAVPGLRTEDAAGVLPEGMPGHVIDRLVDATGGNPLALLEVGGRLSPAQRMGAAPLPDPLPIGARLENVYEHLLGDLSAAAWRAVLLCAATTHQDPTTVVRALGELGIAATDALDEAQERGVLGDGLRFRHPLLRTAALRLATPAERRAAHRSLAGALPTGVDRTWHLAESEAGLSDSLADELVTLAGQDRARHGFAASAAALTRAAALTSDPARSAERLAAAAHQSFVAGDVEHTRTLADRVLSATAPAHARGAVLLTLGTLEQYSGSVPRAAELLAAAADQAAGAQRVWALEELALCRFRLNDLTGILDCADRIDAVADPADPTQHLLAAFTRGLGLTMSGEPATAAPLLAELGSHIDDPALLEDPRLLLCTVLAAAFIGDIRDAEKFTGPLLSAVRSRGAIGLLVPLLAMSAAVSALLGDHDRAFADAGEAADFGDQLGYAADTAVAFEMLAWQSAARGLHGDAERALARARELTDRAATTSVAAHQAITGAFCALCRGDLAQVATLLEARIAADGGVGAMGEPLGIAPMLVEAYVGLGRRTEGAALATQFAALTPEPVSPNAAAIIARCRALAIADDSSAIESFEAALAAHARAQDPTETARTRLLYGARLRRAGHRTAARDQLRTAMDAFAAMGLTAWAQRAADDLSATGAAARPRRRLDTEPLTSQETRVALLVAQGLSNREVAAALFLSPRTVEHHLSSVFRKRGLRSRTGLAHVFATNPPPTT